MQKLIYIVLAALLLTTYSYTENQIKVSIKRNNKGEILLSIDGHTSPVIVEMDGKTTMFNVGDKELNIDEALSVELNTSSGKEQSNIDNQIPPVMSNFNPPLATPY